MQTYYELLGLSPRADAGAVKRAWRQLARIYHPDRTPDDPDAVARFQAVVEAYTVLSDPERRRDYDVTLGFVDVAKANSTPASPEPASGNGDEPRRGKIPDRALVMTVPWTVNIGGGILRVLAPGVGRCEACAGSGRLAEGPCERCEGTGHEHPARIYPVRVDPGLLDGGTLRIPGAGWPSGNGARGDLVVQLALDDPPGMKREGVTVLSTARVTRSTAFMGGVATAPSPDGPYQFRIPPQTLSGTRFAFAGMGLRSGPAAPRGDLIVTVEID